MGNAFIIKLIPLVLLCCSTTPIFAQIGTWYFEGSLHDDVGNMDGTLLPSYFDAPFLADAKSGYAALKLDGTRHVYLGMATLFPVGLSERTISAWAKPTSLAGTATIFSYGTAATNQSMFIGRNGSALIAGAYGNFLTVNNFWTMNTWKHVALTYNGTTAKLYGDGLEIASATMNWNLVKGKAYIGANVTVNNFWTGMIDKVQIFDHALPHSQIASLVQAAQFEEAHWVFNGTANDVSANSHHGQLFGAPVFTIDSKVGSKALLLNGVDQYASFGNGWYIPDGTASRTISAWVMSSDVSGVRTVVAHGTPANNQSMFIGQNGTTLVAGAFGNAITVNNFWANNVWHHICLTYNGVTAKLYTDGILHTSVAKNWPLVRSKVYVGRNVNNLEYWKGAVDDVKIYTTDITAGEVSSLAATPNGNPGVVTITNPSTSSLTISWTDNSTNESHFELYRSTTSPASGFDMTNALSTPTTSITQNNLSEGTTYFYKVRTRNAAGIAAFSPVATAYTKASPPSALTAIPGSASAIHLQWKDNCATETGYRVERSTSSGGSYTLISTTGAGVTAFIDKTSLTAGAPYYYKVRAVYAGGYSDYSNEATATTLTTSKDNETVQELAVWAFQYQYDSRNRMIAKKVPGAEWVYMVYDSRDRLVMTQDANQRSTPKKYWTFTKYDELNRPILTGIKELTRNATQAQMQTSVDSFYNIAGAKFGENYVGNAAGNMHGYSNLSWPTVTMGHAADANHYLTVTYYDRYDFRSLWAGSYVYQNDGLSQTVDGKDYLQPAEENVLVNGQVTGSKVKVLDGVPTWLKAINYFDDKYRVIQTITDNYNGGKDRTSNLYNFIGNALKIRLAHATATSTHTVTRRFDYDHASRIKNIFHQIDGNTEVLLVQNQYNELGQLVDKGLHSEGGSPTKQSIDYRYNIRGWLNSINDLDVSEAGDLFGMNLKYQNPTANGGAAQFNGNISEILWKSADGQNQSYAFTYDPLNRLVEGKYYNTTSTAKNNRFNEKIWDAVLNKTGYDLNGNIRFLQRHGKTGENGGITTYGPMDNLTYTYNGNQLLNVSDVAVKTEGFIDGANTDTDYAYDMNGNIFKDKNKAIDDVTTLNGLSRISYNHLNLVEKVVKSNGEFIKYIYDATGRKLVMEVYNASNQLQKKSDYAGEFFYEDNTLKFVNHEEGRVVMSGTQGEYQYHLKDHLGNVRLTFTTKEETESPTATLEQEYENEEQGDFLRYENVRKVQYYLFDRTKGSAPTTVAGYAERLSGGTNEKFGLARSISVMPGDKITAEVYAKYVDPVSGNRTSGLNTFLNVVAQQIAAGTTGSGTVVDGGSFNTGTSSFPFPAEAGQNTAGSSGTGPKAYLNWLVFDRDYNLITSKSGYKRLSATPKEMGQDVSHERLFSPEITIEQAGYVYIFLSNEETTPVEVYFDDFKVEHVKSPVVQMDDYYPFGLTFNSYSRENSVDQDYKYNGKELQDELGLGWLDYGARMYMPDIGRWGVIDGKAELMKRWTPYHYGANNPIRFIDPDGNTIYDSKGNEVTVVIDKSTGEISEVQGTDDANLRNVIVSTYNDSETGRNTIMALDKKGFKAQVNVHEKGTLWESPDGGYGSVDGLSGPTDAYDTQIDIYGYGIENSAEVNADNFESNFTVTDMYGDQVTNVSPEKKSEIIESVNKGEGAQQHQGHQKSLDKLSPEERKAYDKAVAADKNNPKLRAVNTLIYETANTKAKWGSRGETAGKKAVGNAQTEREKKKQ